MYSSISLSKGIIRTYWECCCDCSFHALIPIFKANEQLLLSFPPHLSSPAPLLEHGQLFYIEVSSLFCTQYNRALVAPKFLLILRCVALLRGSKPRKATNKTCVTPSFEAHLPVFLILCSAVCTRSRPFKWSDPKLN